MPRRVKKSKSVFSPLAENFFSKISTSDKRIRRKFIKYGLWVLSAFFVFSIFNGTYGLKRIIMLELEKKTLIETNREEFVKLIDGDRIRNMLLHDNNYIEYIARTRYHMVYPSETIYRYRGQ